MNFSNGMSSKQAGGAWLRRCVGITAAVEVAGAVAASAAAWGGMVCTEWIKARSRHTMAEWVTAAGMSTVAWHVHSMQAVVSDRSKSFMAAYREQRAGTDHIDGSLRHREG